MTTEILKILHVGVLSKKLFQTKERHMPTFLSSFISSMLLLASVPLEKPDFSDVTECTANETEIQNLQLMRAMSIISITELKKKQEERSISEEENAMLFLAELRLHEIGVAISFREYLQYYCLHPEKRPKSVVDPRTIA